jgi:hypothetical protein
MSGPSKQGGGGISAEEKKGKAERKNYGREQHKERTDVAAAINAVKNQLAAGEQEQNAADKKRRFREWLTIFLLIGTVVAAGLGDAIFYFTMMDTRLANRPLIALTEDDPNIHWDRYSAKIDGFGRVFWNVNYTNKGHGPAVNLQSKFKIEILGIYPITASYSDKPSSPTTLVADEKHFSTVPSLQEMSEADYQRLLKIPKAITVKSTFTYNDVYGAPYETTICATRLDSGAILDCGGGLTTK